MTLEAITHKTINITAQLMLELWNDANLKEAIENCKRISTTTNEAIFLAKNKNDYIGFIYLSLRQEYVEGTSSAPVVYIEGIYIKPTFQQKGIGRFLVQQGEKRGKSKGAKEFASDTETFNQQSINFHKKVGFREANRIVCFIKTID